MGLFKFFGKKSKDDQVKAEPVVHQEALDAPEAAREKPDTSIPEVDFDSLAAFAKESGAIEESDKLWKEVFGLRDWVFIARGDVEKGQIHPFAGKIEERAFVMIFTDCKRAHEFALKHDLTVDGEGTPLLQMPVMNAFHYIYELRKGGLFGAIFNNGENGFHASLEHMIPLYKHLHGELPPWFEQASRIEPSKFDEVVVKCRETGEKEGDEAGKRALFKAALTLPRWFFIADTENGNSPRLIKMENDQVGLLAFSDEDQALRGAEKMKIADKDGKVNVIALENSRLQGMVQHLNEAGVESVVFNGGGECFTIQTGLLCEAAKANSPQAEATNA